MITFTKEQLIASAHARIEFAEMMLAGELEPLKERTWSIELELARIALASLEAEPAIHRWRRVTSEPYGPYPWHYGDFIGFSKPVDGIEDEYFYTAPPVSASAQPLAWLWSHRKHPSEVSLVRPEDDERAEGAHWSGWSCQALYAAPPAPVSVPDDVMAAMQKVARIRLDLNDFDGDKRGILDCLGDAEEALIEVVNRRAAMLQGAEPVTTAYKLRDAVETIRNSGIAIDAEKILAERDAINAPDCWCRTCRTVTISDMRFVVCPECGNKRCPHANDHRHACTGSNEPGQEGSAYPAAPQQEAQ
ncbi:TPA: hypothetical protein ACJJWP_001699 [Enterobacter roggenkampii]